MRKIIAILLCVCTLATLTACGPNVQRDDPVDTTPTVDNAAPTESWSQYVDALKDSNLRLCVYLDLKDVNVENGVINAANDRYEVLHNTQGQYYDYMGLASAKIDDDKPWKHLYHDCYYYATENAWYIHSDRQTFITHPIEDEVVWMRCLSVGELVFITRHQDVYKWNVMDETGKITQSKTIDITEVQSSCDKLFFYTQDGVLLKTSGSDYTTKPTSLPTNCTLLDTYKHFVAHKDVLAVYYFENTDTILRYQGYKNSDIYSIQLPEGYTVEQLTWFEWRNNTINMLMSDNTWWSCEAEHPSVVAFELTKDTAATSWLQQYLKEVHVLSGELLLIANTGYTYHHSASNPHGWTHSAGMYQW
jgi:hypothetical protein